MSLLVRFPFVDDAAADDGHVDARLAERARRGGGQVAVTAAVEDGEVGGLARGGAAAPAFLEGGEGGVGAEDADGLDEAQALVGEPAALGHALRVAARDRGVEAAADEVHRLDGEVAAAGDARAGVEEAAPGVGAGEALAP